MRIVHLLAVDCEPLIDLVREGLVRALSNPLPHQGWMLPDVIERVEKKGNVDLASLPARIRNPHRDRQEQTLAFTHATNLRRANPQLAEIDMRDHFGFSSSPILSTKVRCATCGSAP